MLKRPSGCHLSAIDEGALAGWYVWNKWRIVIKRASLLKNRNGLHTLEDYQHSFPIKQNINIENIKEVYWRLAIVACTQENS
jgi:hypothetical protein